MPDLKAVETFPSGGALAERAVALFLEAARDAVQARGRFTVALTGGSGPVEAYARLARTPESVDWAKAFVFLGDERFVPPDDARSNYGQARRLLLDHVHVPADQVFPVPTDAATPAQAAQEYAGTLARVFGSAPAGPPPAFDLILLGMGDDGHCASLFPHMPSLSVTDRWVVSSPPGTLPPPVDRVTLTFPALNAARRVVFLVGGEKKAAAVKDIFAGGAGLERHPAGGVDPPHGTLTWLLDTQAAALLTRPPAHA